MNLFEKIKLKELQEIRNTPKQTLYVHYDIGDDTNNGSIEKPLLTYREANRRSRKGIDFIIIMKSSKTPEEIKTVAGT